MSKTGHSPSSSPAREKRSSASKSEGSQFCGRVSENENAILNIDNVVSLEPLNSCEICDVVNE